MAWNSVICRISGGFGVSFRGCGGFGRSSGAERKLMAREIKTGTLPEYPIDQWIRKAVYEKVRKDAEEIADQTVKYFTERLALRIGNIVSSIVVDVMSHVEFERVGKNLVIRVRIPEVEAGDAEPASEPEGQAS